RSDAVRLAAVCLLLAACRTAAVDPPDAAQSPQASAEPAPLANVTTAATGTGTETSADARPPAEALRGDRSVPADAPREVRELGGKEPRADSRELAGYAMQAVLHAGEGPPAPKGPEVNALAIDAAKRKLEARIAIEASPTRARFVLSAGFVLPQGTELRSRVDRWGELLFLPDQGTYRVAEEGALRALLGERRLDVAPLSAAEIATPGEGARRLNLRTRRVDVTTRAAKATLELAAFAGIGDGGELVCRFLLDLVGAAPSTAACSTDEVPLHAELHWTTQGALFFDVTSIARRADLPVADLATPPPTASFTAEPLPESAGETLLARNELASMRTAAVDVPPSGPRDAQPPPPDAGMVLVNAGDELRVAWLDGVPAAWVAPGARIALPSLLRGRYTVQWRTFLGDAWDAPQTVTVPGESITGKEASAK
ncbi:MAG TPA: hypothetical protein VIY73_09470, partial [Polyangiaceae bacterium]